MSTSLVSLGTEWRTICFFFNRQVGQGEIRVLQDEAMDPLVFGAFFMHPDQGLSIAKDWVQVGDGQKRRTV